MVVRMFPAAHDKARIVDAIGNVKMLPFDVVGVMIAALPPL